MSISSTEPCDPELTDIRFDGVIDKAISARMKAIFDADQSGRAVDFDKIDWTKLAAEDRQHRIEVLGYLQEGKITAGEDLFYAAMVFQHGNCPDHYQLTRDLAERSLNLDYQPARWLYAAATDRYLVNTGKPQKFGTQYHKVGDSWQLAAVDPATTDEERANYDVPPLAEAKKRAEEMNKKP